jgi:hypothetical protein
MSSATLSAAAQRFARSSAVSTCMAHSLDKSKSRTPATRGRPRFRRLRSLARGASQEGWEGSLALILRGLQAAPHKVARVTARHLSLSRVGEGGRQRRPGEGAAVRPARHWRTARRDSPARDSFVAQPAHGCARRWHDDRRHRRREAGFARATRAWQGSRGRLAARSPSAAPQGAALSHHVFQRIRSRKTSADGRVGARADGPGVPLAGLRFDEQTESDSLYVRTASKS